MSRPILPIFQNGIRFWGSIYIYIYIYIQVLVTLEKLHWLISEGEAALRPEKRSAGRVCFYKAASVEWHPRGVLGAIVPWNYPFHNVFNPVSAALMAGDGIVVKVSEYASWSAANYYGVPGASRIRRHGMRTRPSSSRRSKGSLRRAILPTSCLVTLTLILLTRRPLPLSSKQGSWWIWDMHAHLLYNTLVTMTGGCASHRPRTEHRAPL